MNNKYYNLKAGKDGYQVEATLDVSRDLLNGNYDLIEAETAEKAFAAYRECAESGGDLQEFFESLDLALANGTYDYCMVVEMVYDAGSETWTESDDNYYFASKSKEVQA